MARSQRLIQTLKQQLKVRKITYRKLAEQLNLTESAIKQMFASNNLSLKRLDDICEILDLELTDLAAITDDSTPKLSQLSLENEKKLISDTRLLLVAYCVMNGWSLQEVYKYYEISKAECIHYLAQLDKMKMIDLQVNNRVRSLISHNFEWHPNGPIESFFRKQVQTQFFNSDFSGESELRLVKNGGISMESIHKLNDRLSAIGDLFEELNHEDSKKSSRQRNGTTMVLAIRRWEFQIFRKLERQSNKKAS
ncbi:MAG: helix-turn-helix transcriptional regulator [Thiotrichaceae bacterium]|nr:helix-turn-helix transcriptional regulator [Thiotrichaceae bacterium]